MRLACRLFPLLCLAVQIALAQTPAAQAPPPKAAPQFTVMDGGVRETLESIVIPPKPNAPFTLTLQTEWIKTLYDGGTITTVNQRRIARDGKGRVYQERWFLVPKNGKVESEMTTIQITDPNAHTLYNCFMLEKPHQCVLSYYSATTNAVYKQNTVKTGELSNDRGSAIHDELGKQVINGLETTGTRDSVIYNPWVFGNDRKTTAMWEYWYSPDLGVNLLSIVSDPRFGKQVFTVTDIMLGEPDVKLFDLPEGFEVVDRRPSTPPKVNTEPRPRAVIEENGTSSNN